MFVIKGARRFVILDFGKPIVLTDVVIPACSDLASLSIDVWVQGEEIDGQRFVVASDIGVRSLIMNDIIPTLVCRYLKVRVYTYKLSIFFPTKSRFFKFKIIFNVDVLYVSIMYNNY